MFKISIQVEIFIIIKSPLTKKENDILSFKKHLKFKLVHNSKSQSFHKILKSLLFGYMNFRVLTPQIFGFNSELNTIDLTSC